MPKAIEPASSSTVNLKELEAIMKLMSKHMIDRLELPNGLSLSKKIHLAPEMPKADFSTAPPLQSFISDEEAMFASTSAPRLTLEDFDRFTAQVPPLKDSQ